MSNRRKIMGQIGPSLGQSGGGSVALVNSGPGMTFDSLTKSLNNFSRELSMAAERISMERAHPQKIEDERYLDDIEPTQSPDRTLRRIFQSAKDGGKIEAFDIIEISQSKFATFFLDGKFASLRSVQGFRIREGLWNPNNIQVTTTHGRCELSIIHPISGQSVMREPNRLLFSGKSNKPLPGESVYDEKTGQRIGEIAMVQSEDFLDPDQFIFVVYMRKGSVKKMLRVKSKTVFVSQKGGFAFSEMQDSSNIGAIMVWFKA